MENDSYTKGFRTIGILAIGMVLIGFFSCKKEVPSSYVTEIAVFELKKDKLNRAKEFREAVDQFLRSQAGLISIEHNQDLENPQIFVDKIVWASKEAAIDAGKKAETEPSLIFFFNAMEKSLYFGHTKSLAKPSGSK
ncbi:MAG: hypothetical protein O9301_05505 [Leptospira sp.]|nr:hypothetical protein [Leptospira sp.]